MLTPRFKLSQDEDHIFITVHAPYTNLRDTEIDVDGEDFLFISSPYFLRLRLPGKIIEDDKSKGSYSGDTGEFNLTFNKANSGEHFDNLDMITSLLAPKDIPNLNPLLVEMLEDDGITIETPQKEDDSKKYTYGFANKISKEFDDIGSEFHHIFELRTPETVDFEERQKLRLQFENEKFSSDHYLADMYDLELIESYLSYKPFWEEAHFDKNKDFNEQEVTILKELPNKHYLLTKTEYKQVIHGLVDILYGYCYDKRTTLNDSTVESSWTINKLSATLSWFCVFNELKQTLVCSYRRSLIYPIFRNYELSSKVKNDVVSLVRNGKKLIIKSLIDIHQMFNASNDARYILNQLYIKDYLVFVQKCRNEEISELCNNIANIELTKNDLDLELEELESAAEMVQKEEDDSLDDEIATDMASMTLKANGVTNGINSGSSETEESDNSTASSCDSTDDTSSYLDSDDDPA